MTPSQTRWVARAIIFVPVPIIIGAGFLGWQTVQIVAIAWFFTLGFAICAYNLYDVIRRLTAGGERDGRDEAA
jgi:hypothetical protein